MPMSLCRTAPFLVLMAAFLPACAQAEDRASDAKAGADTSPVSYGQVALNPSDVDDTLRAPSGNSTLSYRGGLVVRSDDKRFGGISGLIVSADGSGLMAVTDTGYWLTASLTHKENTLSGIGSLTLAPMLNPDGQSIAGNKRQGDAEAMTLLADGRIAVSFERNHRVWAYDVTTDGFEATAQPINISPDLKDAVNNKGLEALASLPDGSLLAITEGTMVAEDQIKGWRIGSETTADITLRRIAPFDLTDIALLPSGDLLTLERRFSTLGGVGAQIRRIKADALDEAAPLDGDIIYRSTAGQTVDNMEGISIRTSPDGRTFVYVVSDDNFNPLQRTLLLMFELHPDGKPN
ncbi:MAG: esterase-like activity of phytase family protein [Alphaproteobacteria bacterium]|nr:esterase-like activity of phytase family protein [Alphaproteobacteria bacterium]